MANTKQQQQQQTKNPWPNNLSIQLTRRYIFNVARVEFLHSPMTSFPWPFGVYWRIPLHKTNVIVSKHQAPIVRFTCSSPPFRKHTGPRLDDYIHPVGVTNVRSVSYHKFTANRVCLAPEAALRISNIYIYIHAHTMSYSCCAACLPKSCVGNISYPRTPFFVLVLGVPGAKCIYLFCLLNVAAHRILFPFHAHRRQLA